MIEKLIEKVVVRLLATKLAKIQGEVDAAHNRLKLVNERAANIEHYCGLRRHDHTKTDIRWRFMQLQSDVKNATRPEEIFYKHRPLRAA